MAYDGIDGKLKPGTGRDAGLVPARPGVALGLSPVFRCSNNRYTLKVFNTIYIATMITKNCCHAERYIYLLTGAKNWRLPKN